VRHISVVCLLIGCMFLAGRAPGGIVEATVFQTNDGSEGALMFFPEEIDDVLHNPYMGWVYIDNAIPRYLDAGRSEPYILDGSAWGEVSNVAVLSSWGALEPFEGLYDWSLVDQAVEYWASRGKRIHLRISTAPMVMPWSDFNVGPPEWLYEKGLPYMTREEVGAVIRYPDYRHPLYFEHLERFLAALADHFGDHPAIDLVDLRGYGTWGEWHSGHDLASLEERRQILGRIVQAWVDAFEGHDVLLNLSNSYEWREDILPHGISINQTPKPTYEEYIRASVFDVAFNEPTIALRRDGVAGYVFDAYDGRLMHDFFEATRRPVTSEISSGIQGLRNGDRPGYTPERAVNEALAFHSNYMMMIGWDIVGFLNSGRNRSADGALYFYNTESQGLMQQALRRMGYRLVVTHTRLPERVHPGGALTVEFGIENRGVGRLFKRHDVTFYLMNEGRVAWSATDPMIDLTHVVSGETYRFRSTFDLPDTLSAGEYELRIALTHGGQPAIKLAIAGGDEQLRYPVGRILVGGSGEGELGDAPSAPVDGATGRIEEPSADIPGGVAAAGSPLIVDGKRLGLWAGATYIVDFDYRPVAAPYEYVGGPGSYYFKAERTPTGDQAVRGETHWRDERAAGFFQKSVIVTLGPYDDYRLVWGTNGVGELEVRNIRVTRVPDHARWFEDFSSTDPQTYAFESAVPLQPTGVRVQRDFDPSRPDDEEYVFLESRVPLKPRTSYTVSFTVRQLTGRGRGNDFFVRTSCALAETVGEIGTLRWLDAHDGRTRRKTFTFVTPDCSAPRLQFGVRNGGGAVFDEITLIENGTVRP